MRKVASENLARDDKKPTKKWSWASLTWRRSSPEHKQALEFAKASNQPVRVTTVRKAPSLPMLLRNRRDRSLRHSSSSSSFISPTHLEARDSQLAQTSPARIQQQQHTAPLIQSASSPASTLSVHIADDIPTRGGLTNDDVEAQVRTRRNSGVTVDVLIAPRTPAAPSSPQIMRRTPLSPEVYNAPLAPHFALSPVSLAIPNLKPIRLHLPQTFPEVYNQPANTTATATATTTATPQSSSPAAEVAHKKAATLRGVDSSKRKRSRGHALRRSVTNPDLLDLEALASSAPDTVTFKYKPGPLQLSPKDEPQPPARIGAVPSMSSSSRSLPTSPVRTRPSKERDQADTRPRATTRDRDKAKVDDFMRNLDSARRDLARMHREVTSLGFSRMPNTLVEPRDHPRPVAIPVAQPLSPPVPLKAAPQASQSSHPSMHRARTKMRVLFVHAGRTTADRNQFETVVEDYAFQFNRNHPSGRGVRIKPVVMYTVDEGELLRRIHAEIAALNCIGCVLDPEGILHDASGLAQVPARFPVVVASPGTVPPRLAQSLQGLMIAGCGPFGYYLAIQALVQAVYKS